MRGRRACRRPGRGRERARRRRRPDAGAAADARTRLAANPDTQRGGQMATVKQPAAEDAATGRPAVRRAAVIGTGTMGPGMGAVLARAGIAVAMYDVSEEALDRSKAGVGVAEGVLDQLETPPVDGGSIRYTADLADALENVDFVFEAVPEKLELKQEVFRNLERHVAGDTILTSNTSGIPITKIAEACEKPERVVG